MPYVVATIEHLVTQHTSWDSLIEHNELFVCFGGASAKNAQVSAGGPGQHLLPGSLLAMAEKGTQIVNIIPLKEDLPSGADFHWIAVKPNKNLALMTALAHPILEQSKDPS